MTKHKLPELLEIQNSAVTDFLPTIRNATRALIVRNNHILLLKKEYEDGQTRLAFPGGGQETGETLIQALNRECMEEIGTEVEVTKLLHVAEHFKPRSTEPLIMRHLVDFLFECTVPDSYTPQNGHHPDKHQVAVVWEDIMQVTQPDLFPEILARRVKKSTHNNAKVYLGKQV